MMLAWSEKLVRRGLDGFGKEVQKVRSCLLQSSCAIVRAPPLDTNHTITIRSLGV